MNGFNFRLSDFNCALGISQIDKINFFKKRREIAKFYNRILEKKINILYPNKDSIISAWHLYIVMINFKNQNQKNNFFYI